MSGWRDKAACRDMDPDLFFPTTSSEERLALKACAPMSGDMRMRTVRGATRQNQRRPIARRMGWREQEQKKESK